MTGTVNGLITRRVTDLSLTLKAMTFLFIIQDL